MSQQQQQYTPNEVNSQIKKVHEDAHVRTRKEWSAWADELSPPLSSRFKFDHMEESDADRIMHYFPAMFRQVGGMAYVADENGCWRELQHRSSQVQSIVQRLMIMARRAAGDEVYDEIIDRSPIEKTGYGLYLAKELRMTNWHTACVGAQIRIRILIDEYDVMKVPLEEFDRRDKRPVIPMEIGGSVDLTTGKTLDSVSTSALHIHARDWSLPMLDRAILSDDSPGATAMRDAIRNRFGETLITRIARHALGISKSIDVIVAPSDWGKGTLIDIMSAAFPGMVGRLEAGKALSAGSERFSQVSQHLTGKLWVFIDEAGESGTVTISPGSIKTFVDSVLTVEKKFENALQVPRLGTAIMVGHTWPDVDMSAQGMEQRFGWAISYDGEPEMSRNERSLLLSPEAIKFFRQKVVGRAVALWNENKDDLDAATMTSDIRETVALFRSVQSNSLSQDLRAAFDIGTKDDFVPFTEIEPIFGAHEEKTTGKAVASAMKSAFHGTHLRPGRKRILGNQVRGWFGIVKVD